MPVDENERASQLPDALRRRAHVAGNGELLWPYAAAADAARWAAGAGNGIWGGEVFAPRGPFTAMMVGEWRTEPQWREGEPWALFVSRSLEQAVAALEAKWPGNPEALLFFLAYAPESTFAEESRRERGGSQREVEISKEAESDG